MKILKVALENGRYDLAAHALILSTLQINERENGKKRRPKRQSKR